MTSSLCYGCRAPTHRPTGPSGVPPPAAEGQLLRAEGHRAILQWSHHPQWVAIGRGFLFKDQGVRVVHPPQIGWKSKRGPCSGDHQPPVVCCQGVSIGCSLGYRRGFDPWIDCLETGKPCCALALGVTGVKARPDWAEAHGETTPCPWFASTHLKILGLRKACYFCIFAWSQTGMTSMVSEFFFEVYESFAFGSAQSKPPQNITKHFPRRPWCLCGRWCSHRCSIITSSKGASVQQKDHLTWWLSSALSTC